MSHHSHLSTQPFFAGQKQAFPYTSDHHFVILLTVTNREVSVGRKQVECVNRAKCFSIAAVSLSFLLYGHARAITTINFDPSGGIPAGALPAALSAMGNSPGSPVPSGSQLSNQ